MGYMQTGCRYGFIFPLASLLLLHAAAAAQPPNGVKDETLDFAAMHRQYLERYSGAIESETLSGDCYVYYSTSYYLPGMNGTVTP